MVWGDRFLWLAVAWCGIAGPATAAEPAGLVAHWPLRGDAKDLGPHAWHLQTHGPIDFSAAGPTGEASTAVKLDGREAWLSLAGAKLQDHTDGDFTFSAWVEVPEGSADVPGDLISRFDPKSRRGWWVGVKTSAVTTSVANERQLQFGIDADHQGEWVDCGRPGAALLAFGLAEHEGALYAATCEPDAGRAGRVYRYGGDQTWIDCGAPDGSNSVTALAVFEGALYAGTGKYRVAGSSLPESPNTTLGGRIFRYAGDQRWIDCGRLPETEAIGGFVVYRGALYASSLYRPAGFYRYGGGTEWVSAGTPDGKRVVALAVHDGYLFGSSYDGGHVYRFDGETWVDAGRLADNTQTYSFCVYDGELYVGTWPSGRVYRYRDLNDYEDVGRLGEELEVMGMIAHNGRLLGGTLPLAEVYTYQQDATWHRLKQLDPTPDVKYRRAWTMAEHGGRVYVSTLPSGRIHATSFGLLAHAGTSLPGGWRHVAAVRAGGMLSLMMDGTEVARNELAASADWKLATDAPLRIGRGPHDVLAGSLADVRLYDRALTPDELATVRQALSKAR